MAELQTISTQKSRSRDARPKTVAKSSAKLSAKMSSTLKSSSATGDLMLMSDLRSTMETSRTKTGVGYELKRSLPVERRKRAIGSKSASCSPSTIAVVENSLSPTPTIASTPDNEVEEVKVREKTRLDLATFYDTVTCVAKETVISKTNETDETNDTDVKECNYLTVEGENTKDDFLSVVRRRLSAQVAAKQFKVSKMDSKKDAKTSASDIVEAFVKSEMKKNSSFNDLARVDSGTRRNGVGGGGVSPENGVGEAEHSMSKNPKKLIVFEGMLSDDLPPLNSKIVRIFTSSTFTDTQLERNALMADVYPKIKDYCREKHGLEFQVVDMRWGVRDEATDDHMTTELCMNEIRNCQRLSTGPNFVVFLGQKYGYRPIPTIIDGAEFKKLRECTKQFPDDLALLDKWYQIDTNTVPSVFILRPISTIYYNFNNKRNAKLQDADANAWWDTMCQLQKILRRAVQVLFAARRLDEEGMHNYFMSVTEREIQNGILRAKDTADHTLAYIRNIENMNISLLRVSKLFVDIAGRSVDSEAQTLLDKLRDKKIPAALAEENIARFTVEWTGKEGLDDVNHEEYLKDFCDHFYTSILKLVDDAVKKNDELMNDRIYADILQHLHMCLNLVKLFKGREEIIDNVTEYLKGENNIPLIMYGESGCGKTSLLAKSASLVRDIYSNASPVLLIRFLGTSPDSSTIQPLLDSLCVQISYLYDQPLEDIPSDLVLLQGYFKKLLSCATAESPMVIFLDSLDQISPADGAHSLMWLPTRLPPHVKFVVSSLPKLYGVLDTLFKIIPNQENRIEITPLGADLGGNIITAWLERKQRDVSPSQWKIVNSAISKCNLPLYVKLVFDEICRWRSYSKPQDTTLSHSIHEIINKLFERIENSHGKTLVSRALGYITASKSGLSEAELEDLLSLDEKVLNDVFQYHIPPVRRIPPLLWTRIRNDLPGYLTEREADGVNVINWYHRQFIDVCRERYFRNLNFLNEIHSNIAEYFMGLWGGGSPKPFEYSELQRSRLGADKTGESDRKVPQQPNVYFNSDGKVSRYNLRKLSELPHHLFRSSRYEDLYTECLFNYDFLRAKIASMPLQMTLADFEELQEKVYDKDTKILADTIRLSASMLAHYPDMLGPQIVGRLLPLYTSHPKIRSLIQQCDEKGINFCSLVPTHHCYHTPGGPLQYSLEGHPFAPYGMSVTSDIRYVVSASSKIIIFDLYTGEVFRTINPGIDGIVSALSISPNDKYCVCSTSFNQVIICNIQTGDFQVLQPPVEMDDGILGVSSLTHEFVVYNARAWYIYSIDGTMKQCTPVYTETPLTEIRLKESKQHQFILKSSDPKDRSRTFVVLNANIDNHFEFHTALAVTKDGKMVYACIEISDYDIAIYKRTPRFRWEYQRSFNNLDEVYSLSLSDDETHLAAAVASGFKVWDLKATLSKEGKEVNMPLPSGIRNIPNASSLTGLCLFSRRNEFLCAGVRKYIFVWDGKNGNLVKTLDAHFARVCGLLTVTAPDKTNKLVSSSLDKTIKVWNIDNIYEDVYSIDRMERPVDDLCIADDVFKALTITRNCLGLWNLEDGRLIKTLSSGGISIISTAKITSDGLHIVSAESARDPQQYSEFADSSDDLLARASDLLQEFNTPPVANKFQTMCNGSHENLHEYLSTGNVLIWDVEKGSQIHSTALRDVQQLILNEGDTRCIVVSCIGTKVRCTCIKVPEGDEVYNFELEGPRKFKAAVLTCDGLTLVIPTVNKANETNILSVYHAKTGTHLHKVTLRYNNYQELNNLVAMPTEPHQVAVIDNNKGVIFDIKKKTLVRSINKWNGVVNPSGKYGLYAPTRGGLELLSLVKNSDRPASQTLIPKVAEGVFNVKCMFTKNDKHVVYYHEGHRTIRIFRISDGKQLAHYKCHAEVNVIACTAGGFNLMLGAVDGSFVMLTIADPIDPGSKEILTCLPSRQMVQDSASASQNGLNFGSNVVAAKVVAKARVVKGSRACLIQ